MLTYLLQWAIALFSFCFAVVALRVYGSTRNAAPIYAGAWRLTGLAFLVHALVQAGQYTWGGLAMWRASSEVMTAYLRWAPAMNHSRTALLLFFCIALSAYALGGTELGPRFWQVYVAGLPAAAAVGGVVGGMEGGLLGSRHYPLVAVGDAVELIVLLGALLIAVTRDRLDRLLWGALAVYGFSVALSILWFAALSQIDNPSAWTPRPWGLAGYRALARAAMLVFALRAWHLARIGVRVEGLLSDRRGPRPTLAN